MDFKNMHMCPPCHGGGFIGHSENIEDDVCPYCNGIGSLTKAEVDKIITCSYCDEIAEKVNHTPIVADMTSRAKMCKGCWEMTRDDIKGTYGRDIGEFDQ
ncbi:hypothetical protein SAMN05216232_0203 [Virgibacillus subterraneus]|uniref:Transcription factor zinc-finger domain-containing protein n=1 Tax=Virgibacillus subterraneus TaxID=621109 RepID=A0A1H8YYY3_9BACI|nr:hypothetical protein [Virgibacillus subterraneus]SEP57316.1 hypothetical protein SAMN05216232_0203 [Virgibacillus subterraneus]